MMHAAAFMDDALLVQICITIVEGDLFNIFFYNGSLILRCLLYLVVSIDPRNCFVAKDTDIALNRVRLVIELHPLIARIAPDLQTLSTILTYKYACNSSLIDKKAVHTVGKNQLSSSLVL
jgi:hypothetical protein